MHRYYGPKIHISKIAYLSFIAFLGCLAVSAIFTIWAPYVKSFVFEDSTVGLVAAFLTAVAFFSSFVVVPILEKTKKHKIYFYALTASFISFLLFYFINSLALFLILAIIQSVVVVFRASSFGVIIRNESKLKDIGKNEGLRYTFANLGYVLGPLAAGFIAARYAINSVFLFGAFFIAISLLFFMGLKIRETKNIRKSDFNMLKNMKSYFSDYNRTRAYIMKAGISLWWGIVYIFLPLLILREGLGPEWIGFALFGINVPLLLLEYPLSKIADKRSYKKFFVTGFLILALISLIIFFLSSIYWIIVFFIIASIGAAFIEPLAEAYFFKIIHKKDENKYYAPFLTSLDVGGTVGRLIPALVIIVLAFNYMFLFLFFEMLFFVFIALTLKERKKKVKKAQKIIRRL